MPGTSKATTFNYNNPVNPLERYWVGSTGDCPERIFFTRKEAFDSNTLYLDSFSETGEKIKSYKNASEDDADGAIYTTDF